MFSWPGLPLLPAKGLQWRVPPVADNRSKCLNIRAVLLAFRDDPAILGCWAFGKKRFMKTKLHLVLVAALLGLCVGFITGCKEANTAQADGQHGKYTCTMHPEVVKDAPGSCPKCGMKLVEKK
jgi:hypothetical protein